MYNHPAYWQTIKNEKSVTVGCKSLLKPRLKTLTTNTVDRRRIYVPTRDISKIATYVNPPRAVYPVTPNTGKYVSSGKNIVNKVSDVLLPNARISNDSKRPVKKEKIPIKPPEKVKPTKSRYNLFDDMYKKNDKKKEDAPTKSIPYDIPLLKKRETAGTVKDENDKISKLGDKKLFKLPIAPKKKLSPNTVNNKHKPTDPVSIKKKRPVVRILSTENATLFNKLSHQLRLAVYEGGSANPKTNFKLKRVMKKAVEQKMPMHMIMKTIRAVDPQDNDMNSYLLQLRMLNKIYFILVVRTEYLHDFKRRLLPILKKLDTGFVYALNMFHNSGTIEAIIPLQTAVNFNDLESSIARDAVACRANKIEIVDYETGAVNFKCMPLELPEVCRSIETKGYKILHTDYAFRPKSLIDLNFAEYKQFKELVRKLNKCKEVEEIYHNVKKPPLDDDSFDIEFREEKLDRKMKNPK